ncbi:MAG: chitobiase/beta-hexosaminidase C-terminal domain-containing protein [Bacteroidaceae bacterium]|nr:chitobiase/beta-hexosaminidase C-terminal domain-containing protein [Bacteroidaceae bacterium]
MKSYRMVLSLSDNAKLWSRVASAGFSTVNGYLGMSYALTSAGASWIHSRNTKDGKFQVSTQRIYVKNDLLTYYQSEAAMLASASSYGGINTRDEYLNPQNTIEEIGLDVASASQGGASEQSAGGSAETPTVAAPTISGSTPFEETTSVTMSCSTAGATIYYTTDGSVPTSASTQYSSALTLSDTTTVKAIAVKDNVSSSVASKTFTKGTGDGDGEDVS